MKNLGKIALLLGLIIFNADASVKATLDAKSVELGEMITYSLSISGENIIYAPNPNFNGADSFIYTISDGEYEANATVNVTVVSVNDVAVISGVVAGSVVEDITLNVSDTLTVNDVDINESELVAQTDVVKTYGTFNIDFSLLAYGYDGTATVYSDNGGNDIYNFNPEFLGIGNDPHGGDGEFGIKNYAR